MMDGIFVNSMPDTDCYYILANVVNGSKLVNPTEEKVLNCLLSSNNDIIVFGHGDNNGLYDAALSNYILDLRHRKMLKSRNVIGIFCYAAEFADKYHLHGFFTSMWISNEREAANLGFTDATAEDIEQETQLFLERIVDLLRNNIPLNEWVGRLQAVCDKSKPFVRFNYEALSFFE